MHVETENALLEICLYVKGKKANCHGYFATRYSLMSGLGTHGEEKLSRADAFMALCIFDDVLGSVIGQSIFGH